MPRAKILTAPADELPLADASVDLVVTSPPYWMLREYQQSGQRLEGQIGLEPTWEAYLDNLIRCTREWLRVLKPTGSLWVNLGDKYGRGTRTTVHGGHSKQAYVDGDRPGVCAPTGYEKSLIGLPWRYAIRCTDELGLKLRAEVVWSKVNGLPESVTDRVWRSHEQFFHFVRQESYYSAANEIRLPHSEGTHTGRTRTVGSVSGNGVRHRTFAGNTDTFNPLGRMPGSVWEVPSEPLAIPDYVRGNLGEELDHYAAFPTALVRPVIKGFSPREVCTACGQGRFPVTVTRKVARRPIGQSQVGSSFEDGGGPKGARHNAGHVLSARTVVGSACACTPYTDHPERRAPGWHEHDDREPEPGPVREYHLDSWTPPPSAPGVVLDPFGGTGTTALVAVVHGRNGITSDLGTDYARIARWRTQDGAERARALGEKKTPKKHRLHEELYGELYGELDELMG